MFSGTFLCNFTCVIVKIFYSIHTQNFDICAALHIIDTDYLSGIILTWLALRNCMLTVKTKITGSEASEDCKEMANDMLHAVCLRYWSH